jgi:cell division septation protein DedD
MSFFKTLQADLRERQIFPAVLVLAALAIGIPIAAPTLFGRVSAPAPGSAAIPPITTPTGVRTPQQELADLTTTPSPQAVLRHGAEPDPFRAPAASGKAAVASGSSAKKSTSSTSSTPTTTTPVTTTPKSTTKPSTGSSGATGSSGPTGSTGTPVTGPDTLKSDQAYTVDIDTKDATGVHTLSDVVRLAPLPAADSPEVIYLGVLKGGQKAAFLFTNAIAVSSKPGNKLTCLPSTSACQIIELSPGQGLSLYPTANTALISTFSFELVSIGATTYAGDTDATQARNAVSTAGQTLLPLSNSSELSTLTFEPKIGALVHHSASSGPSHGSTGATGSTGSTGSTGASGGTGGGDSQASAVFFAAR